MNVKKTKSSKKIVLKITMSMTPPYTQNPTSGTIGRSGRIVPVVESPIGPRVQMWQEGVRYLQIACEIFMRLERTSGEIVEEFRRR